MIGKGASMLIKIFSIPFSSLLCDFDDQSMQEFIKDKEVVSITEYHFVRNDIPYLAFIIKYFPFRKEIQAETANSKNRRDQEESWKKILTESDMGLFNILREWRSNRSRKEGVPPYILFTNLQLAQIVKKRPQSAAELMQIEGIGKAKSEKYGEEILSISKINLESVQREKNETV